MSVYKIPISVLVLIYTPDLQILLLERADRAGFWQSVTGSLEGDETLRMAARRELFEETGIAASLDALDDWQVQQRYEIYPHWRHRYASHVTHNTEHWFGFCCPVVQTVTLSPREHRQYQWLDWQTAQRLASSPSNQAAVAMLMRRIQGAI